MMPTLPFDLITIILLMLSTKTLVKFQGVCRAWRDLIRDPIFIKTHFQNWASKGNNYLLYVPLEHTPSRVFRLLSDKTFERALDIQIPFEPISMGLIVIGSCNGLLCITELNNFGTIIYLYNPSIRKYKTINSPITDISGQSDRRYINIALGFAYYDQTNDYKIVRIVSRDEDVDEDGDNVDVNFSYEVANIKIEVYSMITDSWKNIDVDYFPWGMLGIKSKASLNESVHWLVNHRDGNEDVTAILAFHFGNEMFRQISLPNYGADLMECIGIIKGNLSLFLYHVVYEDPLEEQCYLWVMKEYGVVGSWTKMYSITVNPRVVTPLMFTVNEEIIFENGEDVVSYHLGRKTIRSLGLEEQGYFNFVTYTESLVLLEAYNHEPQEG
ncbi:hypothetical protein BUALT_Bualt19G0071500 [Buddleja alternifolia]|uniref:F-box domain-containing protein n=1 Tax=Buddleja alternifolia TaxID=168488 RepID=A0AAV6W2M4_9LAMI|nr:hypothetical protein BUALT_Bualt19G0071500 [Buddleja alternifolia]